MNHHPLFGDGWGGATAASFFSALAWLTGGASPLAVISTLCAIAVGMSKLITDRAKRRALDEFEARKAATPHPLRRATDRPAPDSNPGEL